MTSLRDAAREVIAEADGLGCGAMIGSDNPMEHALGVLARALSAGPMNANNDAHIATLRDLRDWSAKDGDKPALDAAIRALSADRGEAVASAGDGDAVAWRTETPYGVGYLFADELIEAGVCLEGKPPSPAESAEGVLGYIGAGVAVNLFTGYSVTTTITPHKAMLDDVAIYQRPAAPSQVSDAMVERALNAREPYQDTLVRDHLSRGWLHSDDWDDGRCVIRAALEAAQPQPGRVEGMARADNGDPDTIVPARPDKRRPA